MFAKAYEIASQFTHPVVFSMRFFDGSVECVNGTFIILNRDGWIITVAHLLEPFMASQQHAGEISIHKNQILEIEGDSSLNDKQKQRHISRLKTNPKWIINNSFWWGRDGASITKFHLLPEADLAIGKLEPFDPNAMSQYPILKNPKNLPLGTSLCKLGYPFHDVKATFNEENNGFALAPGTLPIPRFPLEGIFTRNAVAGKSRDNKYEIKFIETSSPGLRGQSGGPIFDSQGTVWAIQSRTAHIPLGFNPAVIKNGKSIEENQFINVGLGVHPEVIVKFLQDNGVGFQISDY